MVKAARRVHRDKKEVKDDSGWENVCVCVCGNILLNVKITREQIEHVSMWKVHKTAHEMVYLWHRAL